MSLIIVTPIDFLIRFNGFADKRFTKPNLKLVNQASLNRILKAEIYVNKADGQLRAAHLILGYTPLSFAFQAPKYVIRAGNRRLQHISVAYQGFIVPVGIPLPKDTARTEPLFVTAIPSGASSSQPALGEEEVEEREEDEGEREEEEGVVELSNSSEDFGIFEQSIHSEEDSDKMGVQRKSQRSLQELIEHQPGKSAPSKSMRLSVPFLPPSLLFLPHPNLLTNLPRLPKLMP